MLWSTKYHYTEMDIGWVHLSVESSDTEFSPYFCWVRLGHICYKYYIYTLDPSAGFFKKFG